MMKITARKFVEEALKDCKQGDCVAIDGFPYMVTNRVDANNDILCINLVDGAGDFYSEDYTVVELNAEVVVLEGSRFIDEVL